MRSASRKTRGTRWGCVLFFVLSGVLLVPVKAMAGRITLAWDASPGPVAGYTIYWGTSPGTYPFSVDTTQTTHTFDGLTRGVRYYFIVKAFSANGIYSASSNEVNGVPANAAPLPTNPGDQTVREGPFSLAIAASDPDGDPLIYSATGLPSGLTIHPSSGVISGIVAPGTYTITIRVSDSVAQSTASFTLTAIPNRSPVLQPLPAQTNETDDVVSLQLVASDPDGDVLTLSGAGLPPGLVVNPATGLITGVPTTLGTYTVTVGATDGSVSVSRTFSWTVVAPGSSDFTDDPLIPGVHAMRVVHITELRTRIDALRAGRGLASMSWTLVLGGSTVISAGHITELRTGLNAVYAAMGRPMPIYTDESLSGGMPIRAAHISELRAAIRALP